MVGEMDVIPKLISGSLFFFALYYIILGCLKNFTRLKAVDYRLITMRCVSAVQAVVACCVGIIVINNCMEDVIRKQHWLTEWYIWFGLPYFYYDAWAMYKAYWHKTSSVQCLPTISAVQSFMHSQRLMMFHHLVFPMIYLPLIVWLRGGLGDFFIGCFYMIELAVPFISIRAILLQLGKENTVVFLVNGIIAIIMFAVCRVLIFPFMYWCYANYANISFHSVPFNIPTKCTVGCVGVLIPQIYWLYGMFKVAKRTLKKYDSRVNQ